MWKRAFLKPVNSIIISEQTAKQYTFDQKFERNTTFIEIRWVNPLYAIYRYLFSQWTTIRSEELEISGYWGNMTLGGIGTVYA